MRARACSLVVLGVLAAASRAAAQPAPPAVAAAGVDEQPGARLPLDTPFVDVTAGPVRLGELVDGARPTVLVLAYARCTMLCNLLLRGVVEGAKRTDGVPGIDYQLVVVSLDARETLDEGRRKRTALATDLGRGELHYLVGTREAIDGVARAVGFRYAWDPATEQFAHPAVIFALTPDGRVARYLHGVQFPPDMLDAALADAAAGRMMSTAAADVLNCFRFSPAARRFEERMLGYFRVGAVVMFCLLLGTIVMLVRWEIRQGRSW